MNYAYIRVSTNKQDCSNQKAQILDYCQKNNIKLDEILEITISSTKSEEKRKINNLRKVLKEGDLLITAELSRLGRSMFEIIQFVLELDKKGVNFLFLHQRELSNFQNTASKLLLSIYAYIAENERNLISQRTKAALEKLKNSGKILGRPRGSQSSFYTKDTDKIKALLAKNLSVMDIWRMLYADSGKSYEALLWFCKKRGLVETKKDK